MVVLESSGHWPYANDPERVAAILLPFLKMALPKCGHPVIPLVPNPETWPIGHDQRDLV
jgi:hypothetical protein